MPSLPTERKGRAHGCGHIEIRKPDDIVASFGARGARAVDPRGACERSALPHRPARCATPKPCGAREAHRMRGETVRKSRSRSAARPQIAALDDDMRVTHRARELGAARRYEFDALRRGRRTLFAAFNPSAHGRGLRSVLTTPASKRSPARRAQRLRQPGDDPGRDVHERGPRVAPRLSRVKVRAAPSRC